MFLINHGDTWDTEIHRELNPVLLCVLCDSVVEKKYKHLGLSFQFVRLVEENTNRGEMMLVSSIYQFFLAFFHKAGAKMI